MVPPGSGLSPAGRVQRLVLAFKFRRPLRLSREERRFAVPDTSRIGKIFLAHRDNETVLLERKGTQWIYNGNWKVRPGAMENLLDAVRRIEIKYQPAQAAVPNMVRDLGSEGIKVEIYDKRNRPLAVYYVGGSTPMSGDVRHPGRVQPALRGAFTRVGRQSEVPL
ncbi:MAG: hypothetical protein IPH16_18705 [Haliscomenobacter sp.]|nr:hypothetical protein [Haliscomenobacter sp.]